MGNPSFANPVPYHTHPHSLDSGSTPEAFIRREIELGTGHASSTDHGSLAVCKTMFDSARAKGLTYAAGLEFYFRDDACPILLAKGVPQTSEMVCGACREKWKDGGPRCDCGRSAGVERRTFREHLKYMHGTAHFRTHEAYLCAVRLLSKRDLAAERHGSERKPIFNWGDLEELASHDTTFGSGCLIGMVSRHLLGHDDPETAMAYYERLRSIAKPGNFYVEMFPHCCDRNWVQGVDIDLADGTKRRYYFGKKLRTNVGELDAASLADEWKRKGNQHRELQAVKHFRKWEEGTPIQIVSVKALEDFIPNDARPWAPNGDLQEGCNRFHLWLAERHGDPVLVSDDSHYTVQEDYVVQDVRLGQQGNWRFYGRYHRQTAVECLDYFRNSLGVSDEQFGSWIQNGYDWASTFKSFEMPSRPRLPTPFYPADTLGHTMQLVAKHGRMRWADPVYVERLGRELELFHRNGRIDLLPYFFPIEEICEYFANKGQLALPGRGSAAGALLMYLLNITHADPLRYQLSLDRFLTLDRIQSGALPDIDQDLPDVDVLTRRGGWLEQRFGDCVAQISTDLSLKLRSSVKDVHRALHGRVSPDVEELTKQFVNAPQGITDIKHVFGYVSGDSRVPGSIETDVALRTYATKYPEEWRIVQRCLGLHKGSGRHASAYLISDEPIQNFIPLTEVSGVRVTQYTAKAVEAVGGIKYDFLGLGTGRDLSDAVQLIQERNGKPPAELWVHGIKVPGHRLIPTQPGSPDLVDIWDLPEDQAVFADIAAGRTETVFQFNTAGARKWMKYFDHPRPDGKPIIRSVYDLAVFTALDRPGPLDAYVTHPENGEKHNIVMEYARRARGLAPSKDVPDVISRLMPETYGLITFQEQLQYSYQKLTGATGPEAENFRRLVAKKDMEKVLKKYDFFVERAAPQLGGVDNAKKVWDMYARFGQYGFNMSHSVCYSLIGYATAYLKHHYPLEWWCSVLRNAKKDEIAETFWQHCARFVLMPDISSSGDNFQIEGKKLRAPLWLVDGVGPGAHDELVRGKPYRDIRDLCDRIQERRQAGAKPKAAYVGKDGQEKPERLVQGHSALHRGIISKLILTGVLDSLYPEGTSLFEKMELYERALADSQTAATGKKVRPGAVDLRLLSLDAVGRYQLTKSVLPVYSADLLPYFPADLLMQAYGGKTCLRRAGDPAEFTDAAGMEYWEQRPLEEGANGRPESVVFALAAYVQDVRRFTYQENSKVAWELQLDLTGGRRQLVYWGRKKDGDELRSGMVVAVVVVRSQEERGFSVVDWTVVREPLPEEGEDGLREPRVFGADKEPPAGAIDVTRAGPLGNPFSHLANSTAQFRTKTVQEAVVAYEAWLPTQPQLLPLVQALAGRDLKCVCPPKRGWTASDLGGYRCHGQVLLRFANASPAKPKLVPGWNIYSRTSSGSVAAALTNPTELAYAAGTVTSHYSFQFRGELYADAEQAYEFHGQGCKSASSKDQLMIEVITTKLRQYPELVVAVKAQGGTSFLERCTHFTNAETARYRSWEGVGRGSRFIRNLIAAYEAVSTG